MSNWHSRLGFLPYVESALGGIPIDMAGSKLVLAGYRNYIAAHGSNRSVNGRVFEGLVLESLYREGILPAYYQASVEFIPSVNYDILLYHPKTPVVLSCKTSLRERWKQADLEGLAIKQVYRGARSFLLTMNEKEGNSIQRKVSDSQAVGLDECVVVQGKGDQFDQLLEKLKLTQFVEANAVIPVRGRVVNAASS
ncbi:MAG: hypothetical protein OXG84_10375 [Chloroflexi bacterium]|nr:hypothetical protein [Chloroflexota bacterium]